jgi:hypothetical protein
MAMSATTKTAAGIADAVRDLMHQNRSIDFKTACLWLANAIIAMCQADGSNVPTINTPWSAVPTVTDGATINMPGM